MTKKAWLANVVMPIPPGWEDRSQLIFVGDTGADFRPNIVLVSEEHSGESLQEFVRRHLTTLYDTFENLEVVFDEPAVFGPYQGHLRDYQFTARGRTYQQRQFHTIVGKRVYTFTYSDTKENFRTGMVTLEAVAGNTMLPRGDEGGDVVTG